jgi:hypothetical protein
MRLVFDLPLVDTGIYTSFENRLRKLSTALLQHVTQYEHWTTEWATMTSEGKTQFQRAHRFIVVVPDGVAVATRKMIDESINYHFEPLL